MKQIFFVMAVILSCHVNAQFFKNLGDKAQQAAERVLERKTEEKVEKTTENTVDEVFEAPKKANQKKKKSAKKTNTDEMQAEKTAFPGNIFSTGNASYQTEYLFPVTATIEMEDVSADVQKMTMKQGYGKQALITEMESGNNPVIVDMQNQSAIMLDINRGTAQVMSLEWMQKMMGSAPENEANNTQNPKVVKTGKTKNINGYTCYEYNILHEDGKINAWFAPDVKFDYQDYLRGMAKMFSKKVEENPSQLLNADYGYVMEMTAFTKENKKQSTMKVIALDEKPRLINMNLFTIQKL